MFKKGEFLLRTTKLTFDSFIKIYPEENIRCNVIAELLDENFLILASFTDGDFYFIVNDRSVSQSYESAEEAISNID